MEFVSGLISVIFLCLVFAGSSKLFFERWPSHVDACSNKEFLCRSLDFVWSLCLFINFSEWFNYVSVVGASGVSTSLFNEFISEKNSCVRRLNFSISSFLKDWSSFFTMKASYEYQKQPPEVLCKKRCS